MISEIIRCIKGSCLVSVSGRFPERILNAASGKGIFVENVRKSSDGELIFSVSKKGYALLSKITPENLELKAVERFGLPYVLARHRRRVLLFFMPIALLVSVFVFTRFIWSVEIHGGDSALRIKVGRVLEKNGVRRGVLKSSIDRYKIKNTAIISIDELSWLWVDIKGTTAIVKVHERTAVPKLESIKEPAHVISTESCVIEQIQTFCGRPLYSPGMTVEKGSIIISGMITSENEKVPPYFHHACGIVYGRVWKEKRYTVPKTNIVKTPTGSEKNIYTLNIKKNVNFSLNSGISYAEYDKIEKKVKVPFLPLSFTRTTYYEVTSESVAADTDAQIEHLTQKFSKALAERKAEVSDISTEITDNGSYLSVKLTAQCLMRIDKEIPINTEVENGEDLRSKKQ